MWIRFIGPLVGLAAPVAERRETLRRSNRLVCSCEGERYWFYDRTSIMESIIEAMASMIQHLSPEEALRPIPYITHRDRSG